MININPSRMRPTNRVYTESDKQPSAQSKTYPAPIGGLVTNTPLATPAEQTALVLENFWPTATGIEPRGGTKLRCHIAGSVDSLFQYQSGANKKYFAADANNVYEFSDNTTIGATLTATITGQTNADYSVLEMQTDGGTFLTIVNGQDHAQIYDGTNWQQVTATSTPFAITNVATDHLSHIWSYRNRTFFIEKATMNAWYLGINSVAGAATKLPLAGVFNKGGSLLFGATWSSDSGAGMDDRCVFATDQGEFAIFSGGNPSDVKDWKLNGVYDIGEPLGKNCTMQVGGDLIIATKAGLIPISAATQKDVGQLKLSSLTQKINDVWEQEVALSGTSEQWQIAKWASKNAAFICPPVSSVNKYCYVVNLETGAWSKYTGWAVKSMSNLGRGLFYGDVSGKIYQCDVGGTDDGQVFESRACFAFDHLNAPGSTKTVNAIRGTWRYLTTINPKHTTAKNYQPSFSDPPQAIANAQTGASLWDASDWDVSYWADDNLKNNLLQKWESVSTHGETIAVQVQLTSSESYKLVCELISVDLMYSVGTIL